MEKFLPRKPRLTHTVPGWVEDPEFFVTLCCRPPGENHLCQTPVAIEIFHTFQFYHQTRACRMELLVLMPDHLHGILKVPDAVNLTSWMSDAKRWIHRKTGVTFQENFFDHRLRSPLSAQQKRNYVNRNPVRAGYVSRPDEWPFRFTRSDFETGGAGSLNSQRAILYEATKGLVALPSSKPKTQHR
ncbi:MAG: hypothetical protein EBV83_07345 [Verrucomicrobia bacterium]|nr:hypothetical protein [Verrucomicrobiota bacterium]